MDIYRKCGIVRVESQWQTLRPFTKTDNQIRLMLYKLLVKSSLMWIFEARINLANDNYHVVVKDVRNMVVTAGVRYVVCSQRGSDRLWISLRKTSHRL